MRKLVLSVSVSIALLAAVAPGNAAAKLDRSYGLNGVVDARPPTADRLFLRGLAAAGNGDAFALYEDRCFASACGMRLYRYGPGGHLDQEFGGPNGWFAVPPEVGAVAGLAVDSHGRPLIAERGHGELVVRRLTRRGLPDPAFGGDGEFRMECRCEPSGPRLLPASDGTLTVVLKGYLREDGVVGSVFTLVSLRENGSLNPRFGKGGVARVRVRHADPLSSPFANEETLAAAPTKDGGVYLAGSACCGTGGPSYLVRVSARGRRDNRFLAATRRSLRGLHRLPARLTTAVSSIVVRPRGKIDLLGLTGYSRGFIVRLKPDGRLLRRFGSRGLRKLPRPVRSAALGGEGATFAVSGEGAKPTLMRILPGGRLDRSFGSPGERIPGPAEYTGLGLAVQKGGKVLVLDRGPVDCRLYICSPQPRFVRFVQGRR